LLIYLSIFWGALHFSPFGATVKTSILFLQKWKPDEKMEDYEVFMARIDNIGYDATGRENAESEVQDVIRNFHDQAGWD